MKIARTDKENSLVRLNGSPAPFSTQNDKDGQQPGGQRDEDGKKAPAPRPGGFLFGLLLVSAMLLMLVALLSQNFMLGQEKSISEFRQLYESHEIDVTSVRVQDNAVRAVMNDSTDGKPIAIYVELNTAVRESVMNQVEEITGGRYKAEAPSMLPHFLIWGLMLGGVFALFWMVSRSIRSAGMGGGMIGNFGKSRHRLLNREMTSVTFKDVAGIEEAKEEVGEIIEFLRHPKKFAKLGGRIPRGVLLTGQPGCGKTLLAKAIAGEADVPFFSISGSDFVEMFVGVGASRVRDLFKQAKENAPCIVFLDEIDAVGRKRGSGFTTGGHDEREQTLNAILVEMDGFSTGDGVIVIAATNRPDVLDPALIRPGRFDRQIDVPLPDVKGRLDILSVHARKVTLGPDVKLDKIARGTPMFSGAELAAIMNEAAIIASMADKDFIEHEDLEEARDKIKFGRARKSRIREKDENRLTAYHEAGHAVLQCVLKDCDPLHKVTIIPRGMMGGATFSLPEKDRMGVSLKWLGATMRMSCGGRIAEERAVGDVSSGASADIAHVTNLARLMVEEWGMSERLGFIRYAGSDTRELYMPERGYSEETAKIIDEEVRRIVDEAYREAESLLEANWDKVIAVAEALIKHETLVAEEVHRIMRGEPLTKPTVSDLLEAGNRSAPAGGAMSAKADDSGELPGAIPSPA